MGAEATNQTCPICDTEFAANPVPTGYASHPIMAQFRHECRVCGTYVANARACHELKSIGKRFSGVVRWSAIHSAEPLEITAGNVKSLASTIPKHVDERITHLLRYIGMQSRSLNARVHVDVRWDFPLCYAESPEEMLLYIEELSRRELIKRGSGSEGRQVWLTLDGWRALEGTPNATLSQCFVAMWFDPSMDEAWVNGFEPAIRAAGYAPLKINAREYNGDVMDQVIAEIRSSRFVVADITGNRGGVYYEAGFARGLGLEVIHTCRADEFDHAHFDIDHLNHIVWDSPEQLRERLRNRILATIGRGRFVSEGLRAV